jgi:hypothetical protein
MLSGELRSLFKVPVYKLGDNSDIEKLVDDITIFFEEGNFG